MVRFIFCLLTCLRLLAGSPFTCWTRWGLLMFRFWVSMRITTGVLWLLLAGWKPLGKFIAANGVTRRLASIGAKSLTLSSTKSCGSGYGICDKNKVFGKRGPISCDDAW